MSSSEVLAALAAAVFPATLDGQPVEPNLPATASALATREIDTAQTATRGSGGSSVGRCLPVSDGGARGKAPCRARPPPSGHLTGC